MALSILRVLNILIAALLAGTSFGIWIGLNPRGYSPSTYIEQQQHLVLALNTLMVSLVIVVTLLTFLSAFLQKRKRTTFIVLLIAAICFASCIIISRFGNLPIQKEMLAWDPATPPGNWTALRDKWWSYHIWRTIAELIGLTLVVCASVRTTRTTS